MIYTCYATSNKATVQRCSRSASDNIRTIIEKRESVYVQKFQHLINGTLSSGEFCKVSCQQTRSCRQLLCQRFYRPMTLLSRSNVSRCSFLPLHVGKPLFTDASIVPCSRGVRFFDARFCLPPPPELHETGTIRKLWNRATIYAETKCVHEQLSEIHALGCGLKNCKT